MVTTTFLLLIHGNHAIRLVRREDRSVITLAGNTSDVESGDESDDVMVLLMRPHSNIQGSEC